MDRADRTISDFTREYLADNNLPMNEDDFHIEEFHIGDSGRFMSIFYLDEVIGSLLEYNGELVLTCYYKMDYEVGQKLMN